MIKYIRTNRNFKKLPPHSEGFRMGGEWPNLEILPEAEVIILHENNKINKIYPPKVHRPKILETLHKSGRKLESILCRAKLHYNWPGIRQDIHKHVESCVKCFELQPSKTQARTSGLAIPLLN